MLSMTDAETPKVSFATPDDVRLASEKAFNIWLGAFSPLWAPFLAATATGLGFWSATQVMRRGLGFTNLEVRPDAYLFAKWPGFELPFVTPWSKGWGEAAEEADHISEVAYEALSAPMQIAFDAEEKLDAAIDEAVASIHQSLDQVTPKADDLFAAAETGNYAPNQAVTRTAETTTETAKEAGDDAVEAVTKTARVAEESADTGAEVAKVATKTARDQAEKAATATVKAAKAVIDPVTETPVVPAVAEATAEKLPLPLTEVSPAPAPRKPKKAKA